VPSPLTGGAIGLDTPAAVSLNWKGPYWKDDTPLAPRVCPGDIGVDVRLLELIVPTVFRSVRSRAPRGERPGVPSYYACDRFLRRTRLAVSRLWARLDWFACQCLIFVWSFPLGFPYCFIFYFTYFSFVAFAVVSMHHLLYGRLYSQILVHRINIVRVISHSHAERLDL